MSEIDPNLELWNTPDRKLFFLFPKDFKMPKGELKVRCGPLQTQMVDEDLAMQYACTRKEARAYINARAKQAFGKLHDAMQDARKKAGKTIDEDAKPIDPDELFGTDAGSMMTDGEKAKEGLKNALSFLSSAIESSLPTDQDREEYKQRVEAFSESLMDENGPVAEGMKKLGEAADDVVPALADRLSELGDAFKKSAEKLRTEAGEAAADTEEPES